MENQRIWLVGGTSGIGLKLAKCWLFLGNSLVVSGRNATKNADLKDLVQVYEKKLLLLDLDVTEPLTVNEAKIREAWQRFDGIDLWFYNAGAYEPMTLDNWNSEVFENVAQVNYLGAVRLMNGLLPYFRQQGGGRWVWNVSLAADFGLPYGGAYSAPKAALLNLAQALYPELRQQGIRLQVINHGFVSTRLTEKNRFKMPGLMPPETAAEKITMALRQNANRFEIRFPFMLGLMLTLLKILPYRVSLALTEKMLHATK